jgi:hypothetical protein
MGLLRRRRPPSTPGSPQVRLPRSRRAYRVALLLALSPSALSAQNPGRGQAVEARIEALVQRIEARLEDAIVQSVVEGGIVALPDDATPEEVREAVRRAVLSHDPATLDADALGRDIAREVKREIRAALADMTPSERKRSRAKRPASGLLGLWITTVLAGLLVLFLRPRWLEATGERIHASPGRAAATGIAASVLILPTFVVGIVALVLSIIGIALLPFWMLAFPAAVAVAGIIGLAAGALVTGEAISRRTSEDHWATRSRWRTLASGSALLASPVVAAQILATAGAAPLAWVLAFVAWVVVLTAGSIGFGAALLALVGRRAKVQAATPGAVF